MPTNTIPLSTIPPNFLWKVAIRRPGFRNGSQNKIINAIWPLYIQVLKEYSIDNDNRVCSFTGQVCHESDQFCTAEEYASGASYENRRDLGNIHTGDGIKYKGRGLIQITGRDNYDKYGKMIGVDLINNPMLAAVPLNSLHIACYFWNDHKLSELADKEDIEGVTRKINGGLNGLDERQEATDRAFEALGYSYT